MGNNNELTYSVRFQHNKTDIENIIADVRGRLSNITVDIKGGKVDLSGLNTQIGEVEKSIKALDKLDFNGLKDSFSGLTAQLEKFSAELKSLNTNFGANLGNAIVDALSKADTQIKATIENLNRLAQAEQEAAGGGKKGTPQGVNNAVNLDMAKARIAEIDGLLTSVWKQLNASFKLKFDSGSLDDYSMRLQKLQRELREVVAAGGEGKRVDDILRGANYSALRKDTTNEVKAVNDVSVAIEKLKASLESLSGIKGVGVLRKQINDLLRSLQGNGGNKLAQSEHVNRWLNELVRRAADAAKANEKIQRDASSASRQAAREAEADRQRSYKNLYDNAKEATDAQRQIQAAVRKTREEFDKLYDRRTNLMTLQSLNPRIDLSGPLAQAQARLTGMVEMMRKMETVLGQKGTPERFTQFLATNDINAYKNGLTAFYKEIQDAENRAFGSMKAQEHLDNVKKKIDDIISLMQRAGAAGLPLGDLQRTLQELTSIADKLHEIQQTGKTGGIGLNAWFKTGEYSRGMSQAKDTADRAKRDLDAVAKKNASNADAEIKRLRDAMSQINAIKAKSPELKINGVDRAIEDIKRLMRLLEQAKTQGADIGRIQGIMGAYSPANMAATVAQLAQNQQAAAQAAAQHELAQQRMGQAIAQATGEARQQSQVLGDLRSMAAQYLSVWGASSFIKEVAQITGELELQQKSLEVIIGSAGKAQELFNDIKGMSQMSPYTFQNLLKTTRQLAAFGIETKDLYGTMKQLSDIGAGLDVDVQRLVLAYGHIKSSGVLTGIQRRQLETAGIGITAELAKLYNEQYRASGSSERVTAEDVFKRIKDRQVTFEDVEKVFKRLTGPGGKFENMQLKQYETLGGKLRNLQNNYNIMLDEIGKAHMSLLMGGVDALNSLMENWQKWAGVIKAVGAGLVAVKVAQAALGKSVMAHRAATLTSRAIERESLIASNLGTPAPLPPAGRVRLDESYAQKINDSQLNRFQKARAVMYSNVTKSARELLLVEQGFNPVYAARVAQMKGMELAFHRLRMGALSFFTTMRAGLVALATNPMTWIFAAIAGITALTSRVKELDRVEASMRDNIQRRAKEDIEGIDETLKSLPKTIKKIDVDGVLKIDKNSIPAGEIESMMESLDDALQKYDPLYKGHMFDLERMEDDKDKVIKMMDDLDKARAAKEAVKGKAAMISQGNKDTGGGWKNLWLKDTFLQELKEYQEASIEMQAQIERIASAYETDAERYPLRYKRSDIDKVREFDLRAEIANYYGTKANAVSGDMVREYLSAMINTKDFERAWFEDLNMLFDNRALKSKIASSINKYFEGINPAIEAELKKMQKKDKTGELGAVYLKEQIEQLLNVEGFEISDEEAKKNVSQAILFAINDALSTADPEGAVSVQNGAIQEYLNNFVKEEANKFIDSKGDISNIDKDKLREEYVAHFQSIAVSMQALASNARNGAAIMERFKRAVKDVWDNIDVGGEVDEKLKAWQKKIKDVLKLEKFSDLETEIGIKVTAKTDLASFIEEVQKKFKEAKDKAQNLARGLNIGARLGIKIDADVTFGSREGLLKLYNTLLKVRMKSMWKGFMGDEAAKKTVEDTKAMMDAILPLLKMFNMEKATGYNFHDDKNSEKDAKKKADDAKRKAEEAKRKAEQAARDAEQKEIERFRNIISLVQELRREYKRLRDEGWGKDAALRKTEEYYRRMYGEKGPVDWQQLRGDIARQGPFLENLTKQIKASGAIRDQDAKERLMRDAMRGMVDSENTGQRERSDELLALFNSELESVSESFSNLRKIMDATGRGDIAGAVSGLGEIGVIGGKLSGEIQRMLDLMITAFYQREGLDLAGMKEIDYARAGQMSEREIKEYVSELFGDEGTIDLVKSVTDTLKAYRKAVKDEQKEAVDATVKAMSAMRDYYSQLKLLESQTKRQNDLIDEMTDISADQREAMKRGVLADAYVKALQLEPTYARLMRGDTSLNASQVDGMTTLLSGAYRAQFAAGRLSADELAQKIEELMKSRRTYYSGKREELLDFTAKGRIERELKTLLADFFKIAEDAEKAKERRERALDTKQKAETVYNSLNATFNDNLAKGKLAAQLERQATGERNPARRRELEQEAARLREEITANAVAPSEIREAKQAVDAADMEIKAADIVIQDSRRKLGGKAGEIERKNDEATAEENMRGYINKAIEYLRKFSDAIEFVQGVLDSFGVETMALEDIVGAIGGAVKGAETGMMIGDLFGGMGGMWGAAAGAAIGIAGAIAQLHDKHLQKRIDEIKLDTTRMSNTLDTIKSLRERQLGYDNGGARSMLASMYSGGGAAESAMRDYYTRYGGGSGYEQELRLLEEQRQKLIEMYNLESSKKKKSKEDLEDYSNQIAALDEQIRYYTEDLAKELWGIDLKGWADQLGDALMTAFENGSSAASAFKDTVQDIMRGVVKNMLTVGIIEPALEKLRVKLFGNNGEGGLFDSKNPKGSMGAVLAGLGEWFETEGPALMDAANEFYNGADNMLRQTLGYGMRESEKSTNTVNSITSTASEQTMGIVAGYLSRLSQDVSVQRIMQEMFVNGSWPSYLEQVTTANDSLTAIDRSTTAMMEMMRDGSGALYERVESMSRRLDNFANGIDRIYVN